MWHKVNGNSTIYRESASAFLHLAFTAQTINPLDYEIHGLNCLKRCDRMTLFPDITLFEYLCATTDGFRARCLDFSTPVNFVGLEEELRRVKREIRIRCAGLLEVGPRSQGNPPGATWGPGQTSQRVLKSLRSVRFVHRTARDFLLQTQPGRAALGHCKTSHPDRRCSLLRAALCRMGFLKQECGYRHELQPILLHIGLLFEDQELKRSGAFEALQLVEELYQHDFLSMPQPSPELHFMSVLAGFSALNILFFQRLESLDKATAHRVLIEILALADLPDSSEAPSVENVCKLLERGADPFAMAGTSRLNALWFLVRPYIEDPTAAHASNCDHFITTVQRLNEARPSPANHQWLVEAHFEPDPPNVSLPHFTDINRYRGEISLEFGRHGRDNRGPQAFPILEVNTTTALKLALQRASSDTEPRVQRSCMKLQGAYAPTSPRAPYVVIRSGARPRYFRILKPELLPDVVQVFYDAADGLRSDCKEQLDGFSQWEQAVLRYLEDRTVLESVSLDDIASSYDAQAVS